MSQEIRGEEVHGYPVELQAGQFLRVFVQEDGVDLALYLLDPQGKPVTGTDSLSRGRAEVKEDLAALANETGLYYLRINSGQGSGRYRLTVEGPREPEDEERTRADAVRATWQGMVEPKGSVEEKIRSLEHAFPLWQSLREHRKSAEVLYVLGGRQLSLKQYDLALQNFRQSAEIWAREPGRTARIYHASSLTNLGRCLQKSDRREEAQAVHEQALALASEAGELGLQAENLDNLGQMAQEDGDIRQGIDLQRQALDLARKAGDVKHEAVILNNLAGAYDQLAEPQEALKLYEQALELARDSPDPKRQIKYLNNVGDMYRTLGDWEKALDCFQRAAELSRSSEDHVLRGKILINLALAYRRHLGQVEKARSTLEEALAQGRREPPSRELQAFALVNLATLELEAQRPAEAVKHAREAVVLGRSPEEETLSRYALGEALRSNGDLPGAQAELEKALGLAHKRGDGSTEAQISLILGRVQKERGDLASALSQVQSAIERIESRRNRVVSPELRASFLASKQDYYELKIDILMALDAARRTEGFAADALQTAERGRARGLVEILSEAGDDLREGIDPSLLEREKKAREELNARDWYRRNLLTSESQDSRKLAEAERRLEEARDAYEKVQVELREGSPRYAALTQPQPLNVAEIQRQILDGEALLLEYSLGAEKSFLWAVGSGSLRSFELPGRDQIEEVARRYYKALTTRNDQGSKEPWPAFKKRIAKADIEVEQVGQELSGLILRPVEKLLGNRPLLIVADGALQYIPFAALPAPSSGLPLAAGHEVVNLPSASVLAVMRRELGDRAKSPPFTLALFADPVFHEGDDRLSHGLDKAKRLQLSQRTSSQRRGGMDLSTLRRLRSSEKEANTIAALLPPGQVFKAVGFAASLDTISKTRLDSYRIVHFATHGVLDSRHPELSGLVLSLYDEKGDRRDGFLRLNDVYNLRLDADLVVLSACQTALGKEIRGEGLVGLTRGFMYAGTSRVLASLWSVEDRATAELMESFYRRMLREKLTPAAALRKAQLEMANKPNYKSPYYWAGFSLQGEWR